LRRSKNPEVGWIPIQIKKDNRLLGKRGEVFCFSSHFDEVFDLGKDYEILASSENCAIQAFRLKERLAWGIQMHPEINEEEAIIFLKNMRTKGSKTRAYFERALKQKPQDSGLIHHILKGFFFQ
jgi:GMP synthase (glutamine-hydrolysing)